MKMNTIRNYIITHLRLLASLMEKKDDPCRVQQHNKFDLHRTNRWVCVIPGVDTYVIKSFTFPDVSVSEQLGLRYSTFDVEMYNPVGADVVVTLDTLLRRRSMIDDVTFGFITALGVYDELWTMRGCQLMSYSVGHVDYGDSSPHIIKATFRVSQCTITSNERK